MKKLIYDLFTLILFFSVADNALDASAALSSGIAQKKKPRDNFSVWFYSRRRKGRSILYHIRFYTSMPV